MGKPRLSPDEMVMQVAEDLRYLIAEWHGAIDDAAMRRGSPVLRRLLVDGLLQRAWKAAGFEREPIVRYANLHRALAGKDPSRIHFAHAGGARYKGGVLAGGVVWFPEFRPPAMGPRSDEPPFVSHGLREFVASPCMMIQDIPVSRHHLVKYVANKIGGVHYDTTRPDNFEGLVFKKLDTVAEHVGIMDKNAVYFELLSIGQALGAAEDIRRFVKQVRGAC